MKTVRDIRGFTLVEMMVSVAIIAILLVVAGYNYAGWIGRYRAESFTRTLATDIIKARMRAMQYGQTNCIVINSPTPTYGATMFGTYLVRQDRTSDNLCSAPTDTLVDGFPKPVSPTDTTKDIPTGDNRINIVLLPAAVTAPTGGGNPQFKFSSRGMLVDMDDNLINRLVLKVDYRGECVFPGECDPMKVLRDRTVYPDVDCVIITPTGVDVGVGRLSAATNYTSWDGANCDKK